MNLTDNFQVWLNEEIRKLSVDALNSGLFTCTACGETKGYYVIEYQGEKLRYPAAETYAFLQFAIHNAR